MKIKKKINTATYALVRYRILYVFFIFSFHYSFPQIYQSGEVQISGEDYITVISDKKVERGTIYISKGAVISDSGNLLVAKIITTEFVIEKKKIRKIASEQKQKINSERKTPEIIKIKSKEVFVFSQNSKDFFGNTTKNTSIAMQNAFSQFQLALATIFFKIKNRILERAIGNMFYEGFILSERQNLIFEIRPPPGFETI